MTHGLKLLSFESFPTSILQNRDLSFKPFLFFNRTVVNPESSSEALRSPNFSEYQAANFQGFLPDKIGEKAACPERQ
jgi:hypothetical protein